jgi:hypothetical protein
VVNLGAGNYTVQVEGADGGEGVALVEAYDISTTTLSAVSNLSSRARVGAGEGVLITGFVINPGLRKRVFLRAAGPALAMFGVTDTLAQPELRLYRGSTLIASSGPWSEGPGAAAVRSAVREAGAFAFTEGSADAALVIELEPGAYTVQVSGPGGGVALAEVYELL